MTQPEPSQLMATVARLTASMDTLAALGAHLRVRREGLVVDERVRAQLEKVVLALGPPVAAPEQEELAALGAIRAFFRIAFDLLEDPARASGWTYEDPIVLEAMGRASIGAAGVIADAASALGDLAARFAAPSASFLDVGCGVGWLAIALARRFPALSVTALDIWQPSLTLAERNVQAAQLTGRVQLRKQDVTQLDETAAYDAIWWPAPFLPREVCLGGLPRARQALRAGGWLLFGMFGGPPDPLMDAVTDLRALRSGGHAWTLDEVFELLRALGLQDVRLVDHGAKAPLKLVVGRRDAG